MLYIEPMFIAHTHTVDRETSELNCSVTGKSQEDCPEQTSGTVVNYSQDEKILPSFRRLKQADRANNA